MGLNLCQVWSPIWKRWVLSYIQSYILLLAIQLWHELFTNNNADQTGTVGSHLFINLIQHLGNTMFFLSLSFTLSSHFSKWVLKGFISSIWWCNTMYFIYTHCQCLLQDYQYWLIIPAPFVSAVLNCFSSHSYDFITKRNINFPNNFLKKVNYRKIPKV